MFRRKQQREKSVRSRLNIESLEQRSCLSVTVGLDNATGLLSITGDDAPDTVHVIHEDNVNLLKVQNGSVAYTFVASDVESMFVNLGGGNDSYTESMEQDTNFFRTFPTTIHGAGGKDTIKIDWAGNAFHWVTLKEDIAISIYGAAGADKVQVNIPNVDFANHLDVGVWLGGGRDRLDAVAFGGIAAQGSMSLVAFGEGGADVMNYFGTYDPMNPAGGINVADQAGMNLFFDGGAGKDWLNATYSGEVDGDCYFHLHGDEFNAGGAQRDHVAVHTDTMPGSSGYLYGIVLGGEGNDLLELLAEGDVPANVNLLANGDEGFDTCVNTFNVNVSNCEA